MEKRTTRRKRRLAAAQSARTVWRDHEFGLNLRMHQSGRVHMRWDVSPDSAIALMAVPRAHALIDQMTNLVVHQARQEGDSWNDIGFFLGITGEAARQRYSAAVDELNQPDEGEP